MQAPSSGLGQARELTELFGGGPIAAAIAVLLVAIVALAVLLVRSQRAHLRTATALIPIGEKLQAAIQRNTEVLEESVDVMRQSVTESRAIRLERERVRGERRGRKRDEGREGDG